jgi:uncharacterized protein (DUF302 family)
MARACTFAITSLAAAALAGFSATMALAADPLKTVTVKGTFDDVRTDLQNAIVNQGLRIDYNGKIGDMLKRTGADVGSTKEIYTNAEYFTFCSSKLSRAMMEVDAINVGMCPYSMFAFEVAGQPGVVTIGYRAAAARGDDASQKALATINALLDTILKEASE